MVCLYLGPHLTYYSPFTFYSILALSVFLADSDTRRSWIPTSLRLPVELLDLIASFVTTHRDIISLALTCSTLSQILIPAHATYRTIRIHSRRGPTPLVTISGRPDRAAGVRCFVLFDQWEEGRFLPERAPSIATSCGRTEPHRRGWNSETLEAAARAVQAMPNLHTMVFSMSPRRCGDGILGSCRKHLRLLENPRIYSAASRRARTTPDILGRGADVPSSSSGWVWPHRY